MAIPNYQTAPKFHSAELQFAANHLGHFLLTNLLLSLFRSTGYARIVNLSSEGHCFYDGQLRDLNDLNFNGGTTYNEWSAYGLSKSANILFARSLAAKLKDRGIRAYSVHPGAVINTNLVNTLGEDADWSVALAQFEKTRKYTSPSQGNAEADLRVRPEPPLAENSGGRDCDDCGCCFRSGFR
jgi:NAD(P)-dependent dehydrogenase (short-subunit alcohol dehydrogenase family)